MALTFTLPTDRQLDQANAEALRALNLRNADRPRLKPGAMGCITTPVDIPKGSAIVYDRETSALTVIGPDRECIIHAKPFA